MKFKLLAAIFSGVFIVILMVINLKSGQHSATDKWTSFGLGMISVIFIATAAAFIKGYRKQKTQ